MNVKRFPTLAAFQFRNSLTGRIVVDGLINPTRQAGAVHHRVFDSTLPQEYQCTGFQIDLSGIEVVETNCQRQFASHVAQQRLPDEQGCQCG